MLSDFPFVFVTYPDHPAKDLADFIRMAKAREGRCCAPRRATAPASIWRSNCSPRPPASRCSIVPYRGSPQAATDLLGKRVDAFMDNMTVVAEMVKDGRLRAFGITGPSRFFVLPDVADRSRKPACRATR